VSPRVSGVIALAALGAAATALVAFELARGALGYGGLAVEDPCTTRASGPGEGLDAAVQRIAMSGLYGGACELGTTREELVLSFVPAAGAEEIRWDRPTIERAVRAGLLRAIDDAAGRGDLGDLEAGLLRVVVERAPLDWLIEGGSALRGLLDEGRLDDLLEVLDLAGVL
jgi:hypothetical protein